MSFRLNPPERFNFSNPVEWPDWKDRFLRFRMATKLNKDDGEVQVSCLLYSMGKESEHIMKSFVFTGGDEKKFDPVLKKFDDYFVPKRNIIHERAKFHMRIQKEGESVEVFVRTLYEIAEHCDFADKNEEIRDRLVIGILDKELSEKLQLKPDLTLESAVEMSRQNELVKLQIKDQTASKLVEAVKFNKPGSSQSQGAKSKYAQQKGRKHNYHGAASAPAKRNRCDKCNLFHEYGRCFARGKKCRSCHGYNHFAVCCKNKKVSEVCEDSDPMFLGSVTNCEDNIRPWIIQLDIQGKSVNFKIDSGADTSVISNETYRSFNQPIALKSPSVPLMGPGGKLDCIGTFRAETQLKGKHYTFPVHVINGITGNNLLSRSVAEQMNLIQKVDRVEVDPGVFGSFGLLKCDPVKITVREDAQPYCLTTARRVPFPLLPKVKQELDRLEQEGIIEKVTRPTDWCAPMVPVTKKNGDIRICVDLKKLNDAVKREHYMLPNLDDISPDLNGAKVFSKLDASSGFYQIPLDDKSCELTTFITPMGRYCFKRIPFGITSAPEIFQRHMSELLSGLDGVKVIVDDVLIYGKDDAEHDQHLSAALRKIHDSGLKLNRDKCEFRKTKIEYFGHTISEDGIQPNADRVAAIRNMAPPTNVTELRRVIGMINYLGRFVPNLASVMKPMSDLLKGTNAWTWDSAQDLAFDKVKTLITESPTLVFYDSSKPIVVSADASSYGLGGALFQEVQGSLQPIAFCSRKLTSTEEKYAQIEKECLAALWACEKFSRYLVGLDTFRLLTDHKPLVPLINTQDLNNTPLRCQRMLMKLRSFSLKAEYVPGKNLVVPDTLSRSPVGEDHYDMVHEIENYSIAVDKLRPISDSRLEQIRDAVDKDAIIQKAMNYTRYGWPSHMNTVPIELRDMFASRSELSIAQGLLLYRDRIVIPEQLRVDVLNSIHEGHLGLNKCRARAQASVWWPGITKDIQRKIESCDFCCNNRPAQRKEPAKMTPLPQRPWQKIAADLCEIDQKHYLVITDYYSRFLEIAYLENLTSEQVIGKMKNIFARWGIPEELVTDNGTQFTSFQFRDFAKKYSFRQTFSSPHYPQSNGEAESAVKIAKRILRQEDVFAALMAYRATPIEATGLSPAEMLMGRKIRTVLPTLTSNLTPDWARRDDIRLKDARYKERAKENYDRHNSTQPLSVLNRGDLVRVKTDSDKSWALTGTIKDGDVDRRSYIVQTPKGSYRRNRRHLQVTKNDDQSVESSADIIDFSVKPVVPTDGDVKSSVVTVVPSDDVKQPVVTRSGRVVKPKTFEDYIT